MKKRTRRLVHFEGRSYALRKGIISYPDLQALDGLSTRYWLNQNTVPVGIMKPDHPLTGFGKSGISLNNTEEQTS